MTEESASVTTSVTTEPSKTLKPVSTITPPTISSTITLVPIETRTARASKILDRKVPICAGKGEAFKPPEGFGLDGTIIYHDLDRLDGLSAIGGRPLRNSPLPLDQTEHYGVIGFSPDDRWFAYSPIPRDALGRDFVLESFDIVLESVGNEIIGNTMDVTGFNDQLPSEAKFNSPIEESWINNHLIYTELIAISPNKSDEFGYYPRLPMVFDPFTGKWHPELIEELPDNGIASAAFSTDLKLVLYYVPLKYLVLYDREESKVIWKKDMNWDDISIKWSPDNSYALITKNILSSKEDEKVFIVSKDGDLIKIIADSKYPAKDFSPISTAWSPDSRYIALANVDGILIYDLTKDEYLFQCPVIEGFYPTWSPDSRYLAIGDQRASLKILDINSGEVIEILPHGIPVGWSATFPVEWP